MHSKLSPQHRELSPRKLEEEKKGLPKRDSSHFVLTPSYLNECIKKPISASLSIYFNRRRSDKNHTTRKKKQTNPKMPFSNSTFPNVFDPSLHDGNTFNDYIEAWEMSYDVA